MYDDASALGKGINLTVDINYLVDLAATKLNIAKSELDLEDAAAVDFRSKLESAVAPYLAANSKTDGYVVKISADAGYELAQEHTWAARMREFSKWLEKRE
jgi:hypothetical protein